MSVSSRGPDGPHAARRTVPRVILVLTVLLASGLAGCSMVRMAYDGAPWLLMRSIDRYLDLDGVQEDALQAALEVYHETHRREKLPEIIGALRSLRLKVADGMTDDEWDWAISTVRGIYADTVAGVIPVVTASLGRLDDYQVDQLAQHFDERNAKYKNRFLDGTPESRHQERVEYLVDHLERFVGDLSDAQIAKVSELRKKLPDSTADWYSYRTAQQQKLLTMLRNHAPPPAIDAHFYGWWVERKGQSAALATARDGWILGMRKILAQTEASLSPVQRQKLLETLDEFARSLGES